MSVVFRCAACGQEHTSRLRGNNKEWVKVFLVSGAILELCTQTGEWVRVSLADSRWVEDVQEWGPSTISRGRPR